MIKDGLVGKRTYQQAEKPISRQKDLNQQAIKLVGKKIYQQVEKNLSLTKLIKKGRLNDAKINQQIKTD